MENTLDRYICYGDDGEMKLTRPTTLFGGYDRDETCKMVRRMSDYYRGRIMHLMDQLSEKDKENERLRSTAKAQ